MVGPRPLERAVRDALDEERHEEVFELVDAEPRVLVRDGVLRVDEIPRQAQTQDLGHFLRARLDLGFAAAPFRAAGALAFFAAARLRLPVFFAGSPASPG